MSKINATIMSNPMGRWYIELKDVEKDHKEFCLDFAEFEQKIALMGESYGGEIEVAWSADENVTKEQINEVRMHMQSYEQRIQEEDKMQGFNPNS